MQPREFIESIESAWDRKLPVEQAEIYLKKLSRFSCEQLRVVFDKLLEVCRYMPRVADIFEAARDMGFLQAEVLSSQAHEWAPTDCSLCGGEGMLQVYMIVRFNRTETGNKREVHLSTLGPYSDKRWIGYTPAPGEYAYVFRCSCLAGDAPSLPAGWPKWNNARETQHARAYQQERETARRTERQGGFVPAGRVFAAR